MTTESICTDGAKVELYEWVIAETLENEGIKNYKIEIQGEVDKNEHYASDIVFIEAIGENSDGKKETCSVIIKYGQLDIKIREAIPIRPAFQREIEVYSKVIPRFHKFQYQKGLQLFSSIPKCYLTKLTETREVIVLENLKNRGFFLHDKAIPMDINHIKLVLEAYAEWHALSFTFKYQNSEEFVEIAKNLGKDIWTSIIECNFSDMVNFAQKAFYKILEENGEISVLNNFKRRIGNKEASIILRDLLAQVEEESVLLHADCWNNNFMFQYKDEAKTEPLKVILLDFQTSCIRSPAVDLCYFLYVVSSAKELKQLKELLEYYHGHLCRNIRKLGSDPGEIFTFATLKSHWMKYAAHGALIGLMAPMFLFLDKDSAIDLTNDEELFRRLPTLASNPQYRQRALDIGRHFAEFEF